MFTKEMKNRFNFVDALYCWMILLLFLPHFLEISTQRYLLPSSLFVKEIDKIARWNNYTKLVLQARERMCVGKRDFEKKNGSENGVREKEIPLLYIFWWLRLTAADAVETTLAQCHGLMVMSWIFYWYINLISKKIIFINFCFVNKQKGKWIYLT